MNALMLTAALALGQADPDVIAPASTALDGVWTVVAMEVNGRPTELGEGNRSLAIRNNTLTLPGVAALHGTVRLELGPKGTLRAIPAATGTGNRRDTTDAAPTAGSVGAANGVFVRTADYLVVTIGDPSAATATGTGVGSKPETRQGADPNGPVPVTPNDKTTVTTVGQPPVSLVLRRATGTDAAPSTAATPPPAAPATDTAQPASLRRISTAVGTNVTLSDGTVAGRIEDLVYGDNGALDYAVLSSNGTFSAVPFSAMNWNAAGGVVTLPLTRAQFSTIPTFGTADWSNMLTNPGFTQRIQNTFVNFRDVNGQPIFNLGMNNRIGAQTGNRTTNKVGNQQRNTLQPNNPTGTNQPGQPGTTQPGTVPGTPPTQPGAQPKVPPAAQPKVPPGPQPKVPPGTPPKKDPPPPDRI
jgi:hypothetical protein